MTERLTLQGGLTTLDGAGNTLLETLDSPSRLVVHGQLNAEGELNANSNVNVNGNLNTTGDVTVDGELVVAGDLKVRHNLRVSGKAATGELTVNGILNANAHLSVRRDGGEWVLKTHDDRVVVNAGKFHVMGMMSCRSREWEQH